jgi:hypothetical protein
MSYSYIKSVFPNFGNLDTVNLDTVNLDTVNLDTVKVYNSKLYDNINTESVNSTIPYRQIPDTVEVDQNVKTLLQSNIKSPGTELVACNKESDFYSKQLLEPYENNLEKPNPNKNNLNFYNIPINKEYLNQNIYTKDPSTLEEKIDTDIGKKILKSKYIEQKSIPMQIPMQIPMSCDIYIKHILECSKCKNIAIKQLGIENDKIRNEEIMEVISYFIFALFILLLIDSFKK